MSPKNIKARRTCQGGKILSHARPSTPRHTTITKEEIACVGKQKAKKIVIIQEICREKMFCDGQHYFQAFSRVLQM